MGDQGERDISKPRVVEVRRNEQGAVSELTVEKGLILPLGKYLFAVGLIGAGVVAIPILLASTSYAVADTFGRHQSLWRKPWQNEGFYVILSVALVVSIVLPFSASALFR